MAPRPPYKLLSLGLAKRQRIASNTYRENIQQIEWDDLDKMFEKKELKKEAERVTRYIFKG